MSYLIDIDSKNKIILRPICYQMCPEFTALNDKELLVIILAFDHFSIFRKFNEADRIRRAIIHVYNDNNPKLLESLETKPSNDRITNAVTAYKSLQYNPKRDLAEKYQHKVNALQQILETENAPIAISNILKSIAELRKNIQSLEMEITEEVIGEGRIEGDKELSFLERIKANKKMYEAVISRKPIKI